MDHCQRAYAPLIRAFSVLKTYPNALILFLLLGSFALSRTSYRQTIAVQGSIVFALSEVVYCLTAAFVLIMVGGGWRTHSWRDRLRGLMTFRPQDVPRRSGGALSVAITANRLAALAFPTFVLWQGGAQISRLIQSAAFLDIALTIGVWRILLQPKEVRSWRRNSTTVRPATLADIPQVVAVDQAVWGGICPATEAMFRSRITTFPEGGLLVAEVEGRIVGFASVQYIKDPRAITSATTWQEVSDNGTLARTHTRNGRWIYGVGLACTSEGSKHHAAQMLMHALGVLAVRERKKGILLVARTASYQRYAANLTPQEYVTATRRNGKPLDAELYLYSKASVWVRRPVVIIQDYMEPGCDPKAEGLGVVVEWRNPFCRLPFSQYWAPPLIRRFIH